MVLGPISRPIQPSGVAETDTVCVGRIGFEFRRRPRDPREEAERTCFCCASWRRAAARSSLSSSTSDLPMGSPSRFQEGVGHAAADKHGVGDFHEVLDDFDLVADVRAAKDGNERPRGIRHGFAEIGQLFFHEQTGRGLLDEARDADDRSMRAMRGAKRVADEETVAERGELFRKRFVVLLLLGMKTDVFEQEHFAVARAPCSGLLQLGLHNPAQMPPACREALPVFWRRASMSILDPGRPWGGRDAKREPNGRLSEWRGAASGVFRGCGCRP